MYKHVEHPRTILQHRRHSMAQSARTKPQSKNVSIRGRQRNQADREHLLYCSTASTAQSACTKPQSKYVPIRVRQRKQASRRCWRVPAHVVEHLHSTLSSQNERRNINLPVLQNIHCIQLLTQRWCDARRICLYCRFDLNKIQHCSFSVLSHVFRTRNAFRTTVAAQDRCKLICTLLYLVS